MLPEKVTWTISPISLEFSSSRACRLESTRQGRKRTRLTTHRPSARWRWRGIVSAHQRQMNQREGEDEQDGNSTGHVGGMSDRIIKSTPTG